MMQRETSIPASVLLGGPADYGSYAVVKRMETLKQHFCLKGRRVLDLGCGNGCYTHEIGRLASWVCGLDIQLSNLKDFANPLPRLVGVGEHLPFAESSFDAITMIEVLEHTADDARVLQECFRILRPGGSLVLFVPNKLYPMESHRCHLGGFSIGRNVPFFSWLPDSVRRRICHARIYSARRLLNLTRQAGFTTQHLSYMYPPVDTFPLPRSVKQLYRTASWKLERSILGVFGVSIFGIFDR